MLILILISCGTALAAARKLRKEDLAWQYKSEIKLSTSLVSLIVVLLRY